MKPSIAARSAVAATILCTVSGCFLPAHPEGVSIGLRVDDGVVTLYIPLCAGQKIAWAYLDDPLGDGKQLWRGDGPTDPAAKVVRLGGSGWKSQTGSYRYDGHEIGVGVELADVDFGYGAGVTRKLRSDLPKGTYESNGKQMTPAQLDAQDHC
ncbi:hypothetical protein [Kribbella sp. NPDC051620]|uniref:hypothetical protein n=1 Tax=Kribbella sp. NPDC051620 TaxID=3364120 RepID=UPI00379354EC